MKSLDTICKETRDSLISFGKKTDKAFKEAYEKVKMFFIACFSSQEQTQEHSQQTPPIATED